MDKNVPVYSIVQSADHNGLIKTAIDCNNARFHLRIILAVPHM